MPETPTLLTFVKELLDEGITDPHEAAQEILNDPEWQSVADKYIYRWLTDEIRIAYGGIRSKHRKTGVAISPAWDNVRDTIYSMAINVPGKGYKPFGELTVVDARVIAANRDERAEFFARQAASFSSLATAMEQAGAKTVLELPRTSLKELVAGGL